MKFIFNKKIIILFATIVVITFLGKTVFAVWNGTFYEPGDTLDPECLPTDVDCDVRSPLTSVNISDAVYGAGWDADTTHAASKNAIYDKIETITAGAGTVTSVSVVTANGVSGSVATATTTPAITLTLGAITPTTVNGLAITANGTNTLNIAAGQTLTVTTGGTLGSNAYTSTAYAPLASPTFTGTVTIPTPFTLGAVSVLPTGTELNFVDGVTSSIQTQLDAKGVGDMVLASAQTNSGIKTFLDTTMKLRNVANTFDGYFVNTNTADRIYTLKDAAGTLAFTSDITGTNSGTNTGDQTITLTGGVTGSGTGSFAATVITNANLTGPITSVGNATSVASQTGTGTTFVMDTSPTLVTPALGTPSALVLTNATGLPASAVLAGTFGTGAYTMDTSLTVPTIIGGTATTSDLNLKTTSGIGATGADMHFLVGNNGATEAMTILNSGNVGVGTSTPGSLLSIGSASTFNNAVTTDGTQSFFNIVGTIPSGVAVALNGVKIDITGAGNVVNRALYAVLEAGSLSGSITEAIRGENFSDGGTGGIDLEQPSAAGIGVYGSSSSATAGTNHIGVRGFGSSSSGGGNVIGVAGSVAVASTTTAIGTTGVASSQSGLRVGGFFGVTSWGGGFSPTYESSALIADNKDQAVPIFLARDNGTKVFTIANSGNITIAPIVTATGALKGIVYTGAVNTNQTLSTEIPSMTITTAGRQWATGALTTQREVLITQPTYSFVGASTITDAATVGIAGAPIQSTNATITNTHGLLIQAGAVSTATNSYGLTVNAQTGATNNYSAAFLGGNVGIGTATPTALLNLAAGTTAASTAPLKFTSGSLLTTAEAGAVEFLTDAYYGTITTGAARKTFAFLESPSFTTPALGVATATTLNGLTITANGTNTLNIAAGKSLVVSNSLTFTGTDSSSVAFGTGGTVTYTANKLSAFAATTSAELAGVISDETGSSSGILVFNNAPTITSPIITNIAPGGNFTLTQNSIAALTSVETGAIVNTLYLNAGKVGIGTAGPDTSLDVLNASAAQLRLTSTDGTVYSELYGDSSGDLRISSSTGNVRLLNENLFVCSGGSCASSVTGEGNLVVETGITLDGGAVITLGENAAILQDPALSADGKYNGLTRAGTAGAALAFGDLVYLDPTDSRWELADANAVAAADGDATGILGMVVLAAAGDGSATTILLNGTIRADAVFPAMTVNAPMYVSETAGDITGTQPTTTDAVIRIIGFPLTADELYFNPSNDYMTHI